MRRTIGVSAVLMLIAGVAIAHGPVGEAEVDGAGPSMMDCEHPPQDAVQEVPEELREWIALECASNGVSIIPAADWVWRYPASYFDRPVVAASLAEATEQRHDGPWYFKRLAKIKLSEEARMARNQQMIMDVPLYGEFIQKLHALVQVNAVNNYDETVTLHLAFDSSGHIMGVPCTATCRPEDAFYVERRK